MYKLLKYLLMCVLAPAVMLSACTADDSDRTSASEVSVFIQPMKLQGDVTSDGTVNTMRVMAFDQNGLRKVNTLYLTSSGSNVEFNITPAVYTFVFVGNEPVSTELEAVNHISELDGIAFDSSVFDSDRSQLPMMRTYKQVTVHSDGSGIQVGAGSTVSPWQITLERLAARIDIKLESKADLSGKFTGVKISNLPDKVPLTSGYTGTVTHNSANDRTFAASDFTQLSGSDLSDGMVWGVTLDRAIIPSNEFTPTTNQDNSAELNININDGIDRVFALSVNPANGGLLGDPRNYSIPRNTQVICTGELKVPIDFYIQAADWTSSSTDWNLNGHILRVSQTDVEINHMNGARIHFWSNMENIHVTGTVEEINESGETITTWDTNRVFNSLVALSEFNPAARVHLEEYNWGTRGREGYMDIIMENVSSDTSEPSSVGNRRYKLVLKAASPESGAVERTITVRTKAEAPIMYWGAKTNNQYIGTFHRNGEKGERIITGQHWGWSWSAEVVDGSGWISLSTTPSYDPNVGTSNPGDPELYPVTDGTSSVSGRGRIYFRVGLKGTQNASEAPRYGRIKFTGSADGVDLEQYLYVRQGETADYLMGPADGIQDQSGATVNSISRSASAIKFSPYNLTLPLLKNGGTEAFYQVSPGQGANPSDYFTQYPSQAGLYFMSVTHRQIKESASQAIYNSYLRRGFNPRQTAISWEDWNGLSQPNLLHLWQAPYWTLDAANGYEYGTDNESCPPGYKRPNAGPTKVRSTNATLSEIEKSEMHMSLLLAPMAGDNADATEDIKYLSDRNILSGIYADGYMDRRPLSFPVGYYIAGEGTPLVAYSGILFYNPNNNASVFFPSAGRFVYDYQDALKNDILLDERGSPRYWTSSVGKGYDVWAMTGNAGGMGFASDNALAGMPIRCVKDQ